MEKLKKMIVWIPGVLVLITNLLLYSRLPEKVGLQRQLSGELGNYVPKLVFIIGLPLLMILLSYFIDVKKNKISGVILVNVIVILAEIFVLFANL